ncbi:MAG: DUF4013 domain-containing protein [Acidobacteriota bacterium]|nr:MAG: DUF4013 domain-containing protein [Acidobacteriota bacterium]
MADTTQSVDFGRAFSFAFEDKEWVKKILIGGAFSLLALIVLGLFVILGYCKKVFQLHAENEKAGLPDWEPGENFIDGIIVFIIIFLYNLPWALVLAVPGIGCCLAPMLLFLTVFLLPAGLAHYFDSEQFGDAFDFKKILPFIRENLGNYILYYVIAIVASLASNLGFLLLVVGIIFTSFWSMLVMCQALGQVWRIHKASQPRRGMEPQPTAT